MDSNKKRVKFFGISLGIFIMGLSLVSAWVSTDTEFSNTGVGCIQAEYSAYWVNVTNPTGTIEQINLTGGLVFNISGNVGNCSKYSSVSNGSFCCPIGYSCNVTSGQCIDPDQDYCAVFTNNVSCGTAIEEGPRTIQQYFPGTYNSRCNYTGNTFEGSGVTNGMTCQNVSRCDCFWDEDDEICKAREGNYTECANETTFYRDPIGTCTYTRISEDNKCETLGKIIVKYNVTADPQGYSCQSPPDKEYPCSSVVVVPFFTLTNIIVSILGLGLIYFFSKRDYFLNN